MARKKRVSKTLHFKSKKSYERWVKYIWSNPKLRKKYAGKAPHAKVYIRGKPYKPSHKK